MTIRTLLLIPLVLSIGLFLILSPEIFRTMSVVWPRLLENPGVLGLIVVAVGLQFIGHVIRSVKAAILLRPIEKSKVSTQFRAFSIGQLFNTLLPLRLGEIIRAVIISQKLTISIIYSIVLIVFERAIDLFIITVLALPLLAAVGLLNGTTGVLLIFSFGFSLLGISIVVLLGRQPKWFLASMYRVTSLFNDVVKNKLRFKLWSLGYGLKKTLRKETLLPYGAYTVVMWVIYMSSTFLIANIILHGQPFQMLTSSLGPYYGLGYPSGPAGLGVFYTIASSFVPASFTNATVLAYTTVAWVSLTIPLSLVGVVLLFRDTKELFWMYRPGLASDDSLVNKLLRKEDISAELSTFLENYFRNNSLSQIVNRLEANGSFNLVKYFKGGSDAITILVLQDGRRVVKKIIPIEFKDRLKAQYDWLRKHGSGMIVSVSNEQTADDYYSIDIAYDETSVPLFEYVHEITLDRAKALLDQTWETLHKKAYLEIGKPTRSAKKLDEYIEKHIQLCLEKATTVDEEILRATQPKRLIVNGKQYDNLYQILNKIRKNKQAWSDLSEFRPSNAVHGDVIMDNLLYSKAKQRVIIIDPAPDGNIFEGPVFDFGKAMQSLHCGYEFLLRDESAVSLQGTNRISFREHASSRYKELDRYVQSELAEQYLTPAEKKAMLFHGGVLYLRRLKHQVYYTPENALKFYAVGVRTLNEFYDQYRR